MYIGRPQRKYSFSVVVSIAMVCISGIFTGSISPALAQSESSSRLSSNPGDLRDAFASHPTDANTPEAFARFVAQNEALSQRYARHFGVPQDSIISFFKTALVPYTLEKRQEFTTYGVTKNGDIYPVNTTLPRGAKVWATREGVPVLKWNCSNPIASVLPGSTLVTRPLEYANTPLSTPAQGTFAGITVPDTFTTVSSPSSPDSSFFVSEPSMPADASLAIGGLPETVASNSLPGVDEIVSSGGSHLGSFWPLLLIPLAFAVSNGNTGGTTDVSLPVKTGESTPLQPGTIGTIVAPESNTITLLAGGFPLLLGMLLFSRRRTVA